MANTTDGSFLEDFAENETSTMVAGRVETMPVIKVKYYIKTTFEDSFTGKDGKEIPFYAALIPVKHGLKQVSITKDLFDKVTKPSTYDVTMIYDLNYGKAKFDAVK